MSEHKQKKTPQGVKILGGLNCFLGALSLIRYFKVTPQDFDKALELVRNQNLPADITFQQFKAYNIIPAAVAIMFIASGLGVILGKEWARRTTIYFSFAIVVLIFLAVIAQPGLISLVILQVFYLGTLIMYFTNKNVESYFTLSTNKYAKESNE